MFVVAYNTVELYEDEKETDTDMDAHTQTNTDTGTGTPTSTQTDTAEYTATSTDTTTATSTNSAAKTETEDKDKDNDICNTGSNSHVRTCGIKTTTGSTIRIFIGPSDSKKQEKRKGNVSHNCVVKTVRAGLIYHHFNFIFLNSHFSIFFFYFSTFYPFLPSVCFEGEAIPSRYSSDIFLC